MTFLAFNLSDDVFIMLINVKMPTIVGILTFISMIQFMLNRVEYENSCIPRSQVCFLKCRLEWNKNYITQLNLTFIDLLTESMEERKNILLQNVHRPRREKTCPRGFRPGHTQTSPLSHRDQIENRNFTCSKFRYDIFH